MSDEWWAERVHHRNDDVVCIFWSFLRPARTLLNKARERTSSWTLWFDLIWFDGWWFLHDHQINIPDNLIICRVKSDSDVRGTNKKKNSSLLLFFWGERRGYLALITHSKSYRGYSNDNRWIVVGLDECVRKMVSVGERERDREEGQ